MLSIFQNFFNIYISALEKYLFKSYPLQLSFFFLEVGVMVINCIYVTQVGLA